MNRTQFKKLGWLYIVALSGIAVSILATQLLVQTFISNQDSDSRVINVAGRQRMLSQKISKLVLKLQLEPGDRLVNELDSTVSLWEKSHQGLLNGDTQLGLQGENSDQVKQMFEGIDPFFNKMISSSKMLVKLHSESRLSHMKEQMEVLTNNVLDNESSFLEGMDKIVFQYDDEAKDKVLQLKNLEIILFCISIAIIVLELLFVFRPIAKNVQKSIQELTDSESSSLRMAKDMSKLYDELVKSYQDLEAVDIKPDSNKLLANLDMDGLFIQPTNFFQSLFVNGSLHSFKELMKGNGYGTEFINGLFERLKSGENWSGELKFTNEEGDFVWFELFLISLKHLGEVKVIGRDISEVKEAKLISREINHQKIERKVKEQQYRSVLILEGQEEERKRLARELHDGVGQMLSAMKMSLESVNIPKEPFHNKKRFEDTKDLLKGVIKETRRISFNIIPTNLSEFGIVAATKKLCQEMSKLSNIPIEFENRSSFINRMEHQIESNLYRIIQEGVNNAIKYSKAKSIKVTFEHNLQTLNIMIEDDGRGFDFQSLLSSGHFKSSGHGIYNMKERAAFINASFDIDSHIKKGTKILVVLPIE